MLTDLQTNGQIFFLPLYYNGDSGKVLKMPIGTNLANLGNLIKAATTGLFQTITRTRDKQEPESQRATEFRSTEDSPHAGPPGLLDGVALSQEAQARAQTIRPNTYETQPHTQTAQTAPSQTQVAEETMAARAAAPAMLEEPIDEPPQAPAQLPPAASMAQRQAPQLQQLLQAWLQLDPKTITGLERFLQVEFSHYPEDYQIFMNMRMMTMLRQARRLIEEQKIFGVENEQTAPDTPEGTKRAMVGAAFMGYAYYKVLRKRARIQDRLGLGVRRNEDGTPMTPFGSLQDAMHHLKEAERELQRAMTQGFDNERIRTLAHRVLDICAGIAEMQVEGAIRKEPSPAYG